MRGIVGIVAFIMFAATGLAGCGASDDARAGSTSDPEPSARSTGDQQLAPTQSGASPGRPSTTPSSSPTQRQTELARTIAAVEAKGFTCWSSARSPVDVRTCYPDPGTSGAEEEWVQLDSRGGTIQQIAIDLELEDQPKKAKGLLTKVLGALASTVLDRGAVTTIRSALRKHRPKANIGWGSAETFAADDLDYLTVTLVASGEDELAVPIQDLAVTVGDVRKRYSRRGYRCGIKYDLYLRCLKKKRGAVFGVSTSDTCRDPEGKRQKRACRGQHHVDSVSASVAFNEFDNALGKAMIRHYLDVLDFASGGLHDKARQWFKKNLDGDLHEADFDGIHLEIAPGMAVTGGADVQNGLQVRMSGVEIG